MNGAAASGGRLTLGSLCGVLEPYSNASRTPVHGRGGLGGMKRLAPAVDAPYGMPLKTFTASFARPRTLPADVVAIGLAAARVARGRIRPLARATPVPIPTPIAARREYTLADMSLPRGRVDGSTEDNQIAG